MNSDRLSGVLLAAVVFAAMGVQPAMGAQIGSIVGSVHDFSTATNLQVCVFCHAPHNGAGTTLLWNRAANNSTYTMYTAAISSTMNATVGQPGPVSKLCLSCHDGTVAIDSFGGSPGTTGNTLTGAKNLTKILSDDHPIGFQYNAVLVAADPGLRAVSAVATIGVANTGTIESKLLFGTAGSATVECASCHDVHNSTANTAVNSKLLRITMAGSQLCMTCHVK